MQKLSCWQLLSCQLFPDYSKRFASRFKLSVLPSFVCPGPFVSFPCWRKCAVMMIWVPEAVLKKLPPPSFHGVSKGSESEKN